MLKAVLFDLDNTLLLFDEQEFFKAYLPRIARAFADLMPTNVFRERIMSASQALLQNDGRSSNADYFMKIFSKGFEKRKIRMWDRFLEFYDEQFDDFRGLTTAIPEARDVALKMKEEGFKVVIASNPFWPLRVQMKRLAWAGIEDIPYDHITHIENTSFLKPRPEYYANISDEIDVNASECMMVGNDPVNDMIASTVGMKTYLTTDSRGIDQSLSMSREIRDDISITIPDPDFTGPLRDVPQAVCSIDEI